jgi:putative Mg2+ transporter-C (MgtC) family protein
METLIQELTTGLHDRQQIARIAIRLLAAIIIGGLIGIERERSGKSAGLRTHMIVCLGTALFIITCSAVGMAFDAMSRVIQGIVTGIGFIGAGSILKRSDEQDIKGLTTAAGVWLTAAIGVAVGLGAIGIALICAVLALIILAFAQPLEEFIQRRGGKREETDEATRGDVE